jgi:putative addiction module component (TIGR02574 family)
MSAVGKILQQASTLSSEERATLATLLLESIEHEGAEEVTEAWSAEITRRLAELDAGAETIPWEAVRARLLQHHEKP